MNSLRRMLYWIPAAAWAGTLFWMSNRPAGPGIPPWFLSHDKVTHALAFGFLAALCFLALRAGHRLRLPLAALLAWGAATLYGGIDEIHQSFIPTRHPDWYDVLADATGAALAAGALWVIGASRMNRRPASKPCVGK